MKINGIAKRTVTTVVAGALLASGGLALGATPASTAAVARIADVIAIERAANGKLLAIGRLDRISGPNFSVSVLGQDFALLAGEANFGFVARAEVGRAVALFGDRVNDRFLVDAAIVLDGAYVQGASKVYLRGPVSALNPSLGAFSIGALELDATRFSYDSTTSQMQLGGVAAVVGTQPAISGRVLVERLGQRRVTSPIQIDASVGTGRSYASVGTGRTDASVGTGRSYASVGTGRTDASVGTGRSYASVGTGRTDASVGTGRSYASVGTGRTDASVGTGRADASVGTGRSYASVGTGRTDASVGTGRADASVGTGRSYASVGTGRTDASVGTGRADASVGTGRSYASVGTGRTDASVGTGRADASVGTGRSYASVGTGRT